MCKQTYFYYAVFAVFLLLLLPWFSNYITQAVNVDIAYLTLSAQRLLDGNMMSAAYYDTNLPLSIIVQAPPVLLSKITAIPLYYSISIYIFLLLSLFTAVTYLLLKKIPEFSENQRLLVIMTFIAVNTVMTSYDFGQKDHILAMSLVPLVLVQILITMDIKINGILKWTVLLAGSLLILLKPHYGLVPASIFLHRIIYKHRINIFKDPDFLCLAGMAIVYVGVIYLFFNDFVTVMLPDVIKYYTSSIDSEVKKVGIILMVQALIPLVLCQFFFKKAHFLISVFSFMAFLCLIPFIMQGKGWFYHAIPAYIFFFLALVMLVYYVIGFALSFAITKRPTKTASFVITAIFILTATSYKSLNMIDMPTHEEYKSSEFVKIINKCADENNGECSFLMLNDMINIAHELSIYTGQLHASRFPYMWFAPYLIDAQNALDSGIEPILTQEQIDKAMAKYTNMILDDFNKHSPEIIFVGNFPNLAGDGKLLNFRDYFIEKNPKLKNIWNNYDFERTISIDRIEYMIRKKPNEALINYDIYRKKKQ